MRTPLSGRPLRGWSKLADEVAHRGLGVAPAAVERVTEAELAALPPAARALMAFYGVSPGEPKHWSLRAGWRGRFRLAPNKPWMGIEAIQYNTRDPVARVFHMRARMAGVFPVLARDTYVDGHGRMLGKLAGLVTVVDGEGEEFDVGELAVWLNDAVLLAPSMLLRRDARFSHVDDRRFEVSLRDRGTTVSARVLVDPRGAPVDFETDDRFMSDLEAPKRGLVRCRWSTPISSWQEIGGRLYLARGEATWHLSGGDYTYAVFDLVPDALAFDVPPLPAASGTWTRPAPSAKDARWSSVAPSP
jgi:hypothetical protein